jgi:hypothetical protein
MYTLRTLAVACLLATATPVAQAAGDFSLLPPASRIVGLWDNTAYVGPCGAPPPAVGQKQTLQFIAGGGFVDNSRFPPQGLPNVSGIPGTHQRSIGMGIWTYHPAQREWSLEQRFDWYVDNVYHGYQVIERTMFLSADRKTLTGPVRAVRYNAAGQALFELCGVAESKRL